MRGALRPIFFAFICTTVLSLSDRAGTADAGSGSVPGSDSEVFRRFVKQKYLLEEELADKHGVELSKRAREFFDAAGRGDWITTSNLYSSIKVERNRLNGQSTPAEAWGPLVEVYGTYGLFHRMDRKFADLFGEGIVSNIPAGSIYFGGTDPGRFLVSAYCQSQDEGRPFFTVTQNQLADPDYLAYLLDIYGGKIQVPNTNDLHNCVNLYMTDAAARLRHDQEHPNEPRLVRPGEDIHLDSFGRVQAGGEITAMGVNGLVARLIVEKNPTREFFVEESFPLDWMFSRLVPSGLIMKLDSKIIPQLTGDTLKQDHEFWSEYAARLIGNWITYDTSVKDISAFAETVYINRNMSNFHGDTDYVHDTESQKVFSKLRSSIAGIYSWRLGQSPDGSTVPEKFIAEGKDSAMLEREADFAFKQAFALCPGSPETVYRYVQSLVNWRRIDDAMLVAETARKYAPTNEQFSYLMTNLVSLKGHLPDREKTENEIAELQKEADAHPANFTNQFELAGKYLDIQQNDRALDVLNRVLTNSHITVPVVLSVANAYSQLGQTERLETALEKLTELNPGSPEAWYDLAAVRATLNHDAAAIQALAKALALNTKRLEEDPKSKDLRSNASTDRRFDRLRDNPVFKALLLSP